MGITWSLNGNVITTSLERSVQTSVLAHTDPLQVSSTLAIVSVQRSDIGEVTCTAINPLLPGTPVTSNAATLTITGKGIGRIQVLLFMLILSTVQPFPPSITQQPNDVVTTNGGMTGFSCSAIGKPVPDITWSFGSTVLSPSPQVAITTSNGGGTSVLSLASIEEANVGTYTCTATNSEGTATSDTAQLQLASELPASQLSVSVQLAQWRVDPGGFFGLKRIPLLFIKQ